MMDKLLESILQFLAVIQNANSREETRVLAKRTKFLHIITVSTLPNLDVEKENPYKTLIKSSNFGYKRTIFSLLLKLH